MVSGFYLMANDPYPSKNQTLEPPAIKKVIYIVDLNG